MKISFLLPNEMPLQGARYKYYKLFKDIFQERVNLFRHSFYFSLRKSRPDLIIVFGAFIKSYKYPLRDKIPYILCDHDISSLYSSNQVFHEQIKIKNAYKIIFTSPDHQKYICDKYNYPIDRTMVLYLRPSASDINFEPLKKLPGLNLVYAGGLLDVGSLNGRFGYRCYMDIFKSFIEAGWNVHLYPARSAPPIYKEIGCIFHDQLQEGKDLFRAMSKFTAGLQGYFNAEGAIHYALKCRPNKLWSYLAAGIPTIGFNGGNGMDIYKNKWGIELERLEDIPNLQKRLKKIDISKFRDSEIIEKQSKEVFDFIAN